MYESFIFYASFHEACKDLEQAQYGAIMYVLNEYALNGIIPDSFDDPIVKMAFTFMKPQIDANNARKEAAHKGGRPKSNTKPLDTNIEEKTKPLDMENTKNEKPVDIKNDEKSKPNVNANANANENVNANVKDMASTACDAEVTTISKPKEKKPPLREREPQNDIEKVEKAYLSQWDGLYKDGILQTPEPPSGQWNCARSLIKQNLDNGITAEQLVDAVDNAACDHFVLQGGYSLKTIMSSGVLNRLVNGQKEMPKVFGKPLLQNDIEASKVMGDIIERTHKILENYDPERKVPNEADMW